MKVRSLLVLAALGALLVPAASHANQCDTNIFLFTDHDSGQPDPVWPGHTFTTTVLTTSAVGCTVVRDTVLTGTVDDPNDPMWDPITDTDYIYPGANSVYVRFLNNGTDPSIVASATMTFAGTTYALHMDVGRGIEGLTGSSWLDSDPIAIDPAQTLLPNQAVVSICLNDGSCYSRTYRTVAST